MLEGLEAPEGPVVLASGAVAFVEQLRGQVTRWDAAAGPHVVSRGPGAPNSIALGSDGALYAAQNGGVVNEWRAEVPTHPAIERRGLDGTIETLVTAIGDDPLRAPNDLVFGPDGRLYVTDPGEAYDPQHPKALSRIIAIGSGGSEVVASPGRCYVNGLAFDPEGALIWVESYTRRVVRQVDGEPEVIAMLPELHVPDGLAVARDGRLFIASVTSHGVSILGPDGAYLGLIELDDRAIPTNCAFDGSALWVTDFGDGFTPGAGDGRLWRVDTDAVGALLGAGHLP